jgi:hypothetical protein
MTFKRYAAAAAITLSLAATGLISPNLFSQARETFKARLSAMPADARTRAGLAGSGSVTATLDGKMLSISGSFEGLVSPATTANLHSAVAAGVRGPSIADLTIAKATNGAITGTVNVTDEQMVSLQHNGFYVEIHSEKAPDGAIWGWLMKSGH